MKFRDCFCIAKLNFRCFAIKFAVGTLLALFLPLSGRFSQALPHYDQVCTKGQQLNRSNLLELITLPLFYSLLQQSHSLIYFFRAPVELFPVRIALPFLFTL